MEQEEIVIKKGKKVKQTKQIKLREYNIQQPDYAQTPGAVLIYHQDRLTQIHEESCQAKVKTVAGDLLPEGSQAVPADASANKPTTATSQDQSGAKTPTNKSKKEKPPTVQIETPLITPS